MNACNCSTCGNNPRLPGFFVDGPSHYDMCAVCDGPFDNEDWDVTTEVSEYSKSGYETKYYHTTCLKGEKYAGDRVA